MKKLIFTLAILMNSVLLFATPPVLEVRVTANEVKMYHQAGTSSELVRSLKSTEEIFLIRQHNNNWAIVSVNGQTGYVLSSELAFTKKGNGIVKRSGS